MGGYGTSWKTVPRAVCTYKQVAWPSPKGREKESKNPREKSYSSCVARSRRCRQKKEGKKKKTQRAKRKRASGNFGTTPKERESASNFPRVSSLSRALFLGKTPCCCCCGGWSLLVAVFVSRIPIPAEAACFFFFWRRFPFGIRVLIFTFKLSVNNILS